MSFYLTPKESATAACLLDGLRGHAMAEALGVSLDAKSRRLERLRAKLGAPSTHRLRERLAALAGVELNRPLGTGEPK